MRQQPALVVPFQFFCCEPAHSLNKTTFDLAAVNRFIDRIARVMKNVGAQHSMHSGEASDLDLAHRRAISEIMEWLAVACNSIPMNPRRGIKSRCRKADALQVSSACDIPERNFDLRR